MEQKVVLWAVFKVNIESILKTLKPISQVPSTSVLPLHFVTNYRVDFFWKFIFHWTINRPQKHFTYVLETMLRQKSFGSEKKIYFLSTYMLLCHTYLSKSNSNKILFTGSKWRICCYDQEKERFRGQHRTLFPKIRQGRETHLWTRGWKRSVEWHGSRPGFETHQHYWRCSSSFRSCCLLGKDYKL